MRPYRNESGKQAMQPSIDNKEQRIELLIVRGKAALALNDPEELRRFLVESRLGIAVEKAESAGRTLLQMLQRTEDERTVIDVQENETKKLGGHHLRPSQELLAYWKALADEGLSIPAILQKSKERLGSLGVFSHSCVRSHLLKMAKDELDESAPEHEQPPEATQADRAPRSKPAKAKPISGKMTPKMRQRMYELFDEGLSPKLAYIQLIRENGPLPFTLGTVSFHKSRTWVRKERPSKEEPVIAPERQSAPEPVTTPT